MDQSLDNRKSSAGMRALSIAFPRILRTNRYWKLRYPAMVEQAEQFTLAKLWNRAEVPADHQPSTFELTMRPYLEDPFRGAVERRLRAPDEPALEMELAAAQGALAAANLGPADIDLTLVSSFVGDRYGVGNAAFVAASLELDSPAWNFESACSGSLVGLHMASDLVRSGAYARILVITSTSNSVQVDDSDSLGWFVGDGAGAFLVESLKPGYGVLAQATINSVATNDMFVIHSTPDADLPTRLRTSANPKAADMARDSAEPYLRRCVEEATRRAGVDIGDVDFWVFNTPNAWYADFCARVLGIEAGRYHSVYPRYANIGAALMPATLYHALHEGKVRSGDLVGMYSIGSTSTASSVLMRMPEVALGPVPERPSITETSGEGVMRR